MVPLGSGSHPGKPLLSFWSLARVEIVETSTLGTTVLRAPALTRKVGLKVLNNDLKSILRRMRPDMLLIEIIEKRAGDNLPPTTLHDLEDAQHRRDCRTQVAQVECCIEVAYAQK